MALTKAELAALYTKRAQHYNFTANLYYLIGYRESLYRKKTINALNLAAGDTVLEIACGTGMNFPLLQEKIGPDGKIIGIDLTQKMLDQAQKRVDAEGWTNVTLEQADAAQCAFPQGLNAIFSTYALTLIPEYKHIIQKAGQSLAPGGRFAVLDFKQPDKCPMWLVKLMVLIMKPFGVTLDLTERHPWEEIEKHFPKTDFKQLYFGFSYLAVGETDGEM